MPTNFWSTAVATPGKPSHGCIAGDSDFVPAAKHARRAGIDFVLDPMWARISDSLHEHIDGLWECVRREPENLNDPLHVDKLQDRRELPTIDDADFDLEGL